MGGELRILRRQHDASGLGEYSTTDERHHHLRQRSGQLGTGHQQQAVGPAQRRRQAVSGDDIGEPAAGAAVRADAQHLVGEPLHQFAAGRISDQAAESMELAPLTAGGGRQGLA